MNKIKVKIIGTEYQGNRILNSQHQPEPDLPQNITYKEIEIEGPDVPIKDNQFIKKIGKKWYLVTDITRGDE